jgi:hypothetical protein
MSCGLAIATALFLSDPHVALAAAAPPPAADAPVSVAAEPLFSDIIGRSGALKAVVDGWIASHAADAEGFAAGPEFTGFAGQAEALAALDMQGHLILKERGTDGDLKCILRGIAEDMPKKVADVAEASSPEARAVALSELAYLLNDNVEVITAPPQPEV